MPVAITLSGGGARGDFEVGAVRCLYDRGIRPGIICGCSVGAINGAKLAEGEGNLDQGLQGLESLWLGLQTNTDMWLEEDWLNNIDPDIKALLIGVGEGHIDPPPPEFDRSEDWSNWGTELGKLFHLVRSIFWLTDQGADILTALGEISRAISLYNLRPIERLISNQLSEARMLDWSQGGARKLRLAVVGLESGALRYVTESGNLLERDNSTAVLEANSGVCQQIADTIEALQNSLLGVEERLQNAAPGEKPRLVAQIRETNEQIQDEQRNLQDCIARNPPIRSVQAPVGRGVLASSAIAGFFPPVILGDERYVDGGFREVIPVQAAVDLAGDPIYSISASKPDIDRAPPFAGRTMLDFVGRALADIAINEIALNDVNPPGGWGPRGVHRIFPTVDIHDLLTIDPGLIRISMAYGYMRAADVLDGRSPTDRAWQLSDEIAQLRKETWRLECYVHGQPVPTDRPASAPPPRPDLLPTVRDSKNRLRDLIDERSRMGGAMPGDAEMWRDNWERHPWQPTEILWPPVRPARCGEINREIAFSEIQIEGKMETIDQLDPRRDIARIRQLNAEIEALEQEISNLRQEAVSLGC